MEWTTIPACPILMCFFNRGNTDGINSSKILCLMFVYVLFCDWFVSVCFRTDFVVFGEFVVWWPACRVNRRQIEVCFSPDVICCGWLGSEYQLTNLQCWSDRGQSFLIVLWKIVEYILFWHLSSSCGWWFDVPGTLPACQSVCYFLNTSALSRCWSAYRLWMLTDWKPLLR